MGSNFEGIELKMLNFSINPQNETQHNNIKVIKFYNNVQPFVLVKNDILNTSDIPTWNARQIVVFDFETNLGFSGDRIGKIIAQYSNQTFTDNELNFDFSGYTVFKILKIKKIGGSETFKNIQETIDSFDSNGNVSGTQLENINIVKESFDTQSTLKINFSQSTAYFMFGFKCSSTKSLLYNTDESNSQNHTFDNMLYIYNNNFTTGFSSSFVESSIKLKLLMTNINPIEIVNTSPVSNYNILFNNNTSTTIDTGTTNEIVFYIEILSGVTNSKINLRFISDDIIFNTFVPEYKQVGSNQYLVSSTPSGLNPDLYKFNISVFKISAVDKTTRSTTSVISLNGSRNIEFFIEPDLKQEYFGGANPLVPALRIIITNQNPQIFSMVNEIRFPSIDPNNISDISNSEFTITSTSNPDNLNNLLFVSFEVKSASSLFDAVTIPNISIQVASILSNSTKCFINTADNIVSYVPTINISTAPGTIEDLSSATLTGTNVQTAVTSQVYNFIVKVVDNQFVIEYDTTLQLDPIIRRFSSLINDISFQAFENDTYIFDTSHFSNQNHLLTFFTNSTINSNNELLNKVVYDDNINQGEPGSRIILTVPLSTSYPTIFISDFPSGASLQNKLNGLCKINILANPTNINIGTFNFTLLKGGGISTMSLVPNLDSNGIPVEGINDLTIGMDSNNTDATRISELFSGEQTPIPIIKVYSIYLPKPDNLTFTVFNKTFITLNWNVNNGTIYPFANPRNSRFTISVYYNVYREDSDTTNISLIGTTIFNSFTDTTATNFNNYNYYIESVATWEGTSITSLRSDPLFVFVCENNRFPNGRWNNSFSNPKLYKQLSSCSDRNSITSNLFPNSWSISKKQTYARLANLSINKR